MTTETFAPSDEVSDDVASVIADAVHGLASLSPWPMRFEDWYHDLPLWLAIETPRPLQPYRVVQASVLLVRDEQLVEVSGERREARDGSILLQPVIPESFVRRMPVAEVTRVKESVTALWSQIADYPQRGATWEKIPTERPRGSTSELGEVLRVLQVPEPTPLEIPATTHMATERLPRIRPAPAGLIVDYRPTTSDRDAAAYQQASLLHLFDDGLPVRPGKLEDLGAPKRWVGTGGAAGATVLTVIALVESPIRGRLDRVLRVITSQQAWKPIRNGVMKLAKNPPVGTPDAYVQLAIRFGPPQWALFRLDHAAEEAIDAIGRIGVPIQVTPEFFLEFEWANGRWRLYAS